MSDPQFYRDQVTARFAGMFADLEREVPGLPPEAYEQIRKSCAEVLDKQFSEGLWGKIEQRGFVEFIEQLLTHQGGTIPDLENLFERKVELDRRLLGEPPDDRP